MNEVRNRTIEIENRGDFNFDFQIKTPGQRNTFIQINPENGTVKQNERKQLEIIYRPICDNKLKT